MASGRKRRERIKRARAAQVRLAAAQDQLLGLDEEFDLADAATSELDIVALDRDGAVAKRYGAYADWMVAHFARRYTFLIDAQGKIAKTYLKVDTSKHSAEIIADLKQASSSPGK